MSENYDGQGKSEAEEVHSSMVVVALALVVSGLFVLGAIGLLVWALV